MACTLRVLPLPPPPRANAAAAATATAAVRNFVRGVAVSVVVLTPPQPQGGVAKSCEVDGHLDAGRVGVDVDGSPPLLSGPDERGMASPLQSALWLFPPHPSGWGGLLPEVLCKAGLTM